VDPRLEFARELERRDDAVAGRLELLARLAADTDRVAARAGAVVAFFARLPREREHVEAAAREAEAALSRAQTAVTEAEDVLARARKDDARAAAERAIAAARGDVRAAEERRARASDRRAVLEQEAEQLGAEARDLEREAARLAADLETAPRVSPTEPPGEGLEAVLEWAARADAAIFVARGGLESERERIVREANELAASALGEPLYATNVASVRRRLEERLA